MLSILVVGDTKNTQTHSYKIEREMCNDAII